MKKAKFIFTFAETLGCVASISIFVSCQSKQTKAKNDHPNVIFLLTDDQGIGDLSCNHNPWIHTPNLDTLYNESVHFSNFHVSPYSAPTRGALMTGRYPIRNGEWATYKGRDIISRTSPMLPQIFRDNGYTTAHFGKWHLGDNYPQRPTDCGFDLSIQHLSGGDGELSDYWGNNYYNDTYRVNNVPKKFKGYCTDIWFEQTEKFIKKQEESNKPFFIYLATNAPHSPHWVPEKYAAPYRYLEKGGQIKDAGFYGQIVNIDENLGKLETFLKEEGLYENTIFIFMTDNGSSSGTNMEGTKGYNYGYRGKKSSHFEGGHIVPFFLRWPAAGLDKKQEISELSAHIDILPTLSSLCNLKIPEQNKIDGIDLSDVILYNKKLDNRTIFVHNRQDSKPPMDVKQTCIIKNEWRLVDGNKLYDIQNDRHEDNNIIKENKVIAKELLNENEKFLEPTKELDEYKYFNSPIAGSTHQPIITMTIQHAIGSSNGIWKSSQVAQGIKSPNCEYAIEIAKDGIYKFSLARWPRECPGKVLGIPAYNPKNGMFDYKVIKATSAVLEIDGKKYKKEITADDNEINFEIPLKQGKIKMKTYFIENNSTYGVYYNYIERIK